MIKPAVSYAAGHSGGIWAASNKERTRVKRAKEEQKKPAKRFRPVVLLVLLCALVLLAVICWDNIQEKLGVTFQAIGTETENLVGE